MSKDYLRSKIFELCEEIISTWNDFLGEFNVYIQESLLYIEFPYFILKNEKHNYRYSFSLRESKDSFIIYRNVKCSCKTMS